MQPLHGGTLTHTGLGVRYSRLQARVSHAALVGTAPGGTVRASHGD